MKRYKIVFLIALILCLSIATTVFAESIRVVIDSDGESIYYVDESEMSESEFAAQYPDLYQTYKDLEKEHETSDQDVYNKLVKDGYKYYDAADVPNVIKDFVSSYHEGSLSIFYEGSSDIAYNFGDFLPTSYFATYKDFEYTNINMKGAPTGVQIPLQLNAYSASS